MPSAPRNADAGARSVRAGRGGAGVQHGVLAPAQWMDDGVAHLAVSGPGRDDLADGAAVERGIQGKRRGVGLDVVHPAAHVGVHRDEEVADQDLAVLEFGQRRLGQAEVLRHRAAVRPGRQLDLAGGGGQGGGVGVGAHAATSRILMSTSCCRGWRWSRGRPRAPWPRGPRPCPGPRRAGRSRVPRRGRSRRRRRGRRCGSWRRRRNPSGRPFLARRRGAGRSGSRPRSRRRRAAPGWCPRRCRPVPPGWPGSRRACRPWCGRCRRGLRRKPGPRLCRESSWVFRSVGMSGRAEVCGCSVASAWSAAVSRPEGLAELVSSRGREPGGVSEPLRDARRPAR